MFSEYKWKKEEEGKGNEGKSDISKNYFPVEGKVFSLSGCIPIINQIGIL